VLTGAVWLPVGAWLPYGGRERGEPMACAPSTSTPPPGVDAWRVYRQGLCEVDWSGALQNTSWNIAPKGILRLHGQGARRCREKLEASDCAHRPPEACFHWNEASGEWKGAAYTLVNSAVWKQGDLVA
jgi:hypothetical protein